MNRLLTRLFLCALLGMTSGMLTGQKLIGDDRRGAPAELHPVLRPDGTQLYFTRPDFAQNKGTDNAADVWVRTRYPDGSWGRALNPGSPVNSFAHDRAVSVSPDGSRLAVLRSGVANSLELLEVAGRSWRIVARWPLPADAAPRLDLTFDANASVLIYSATAAGQLDLFQRRALPGGTWSDRSPLSQFNGPGDETTPQLAADGRTLYFRRAGGRWYRSSSPNERPRAVAIDPAVSGFAVLPGATAMIATTASGDRLRLRSLPVDGRDAPPPARLGRGRLRVPLPPGEQLALIEVGSEYPLYVHPDDQGSYAVFLRSGESLGFAPGGTLSSPPTGGRANSSLIAGKGRPETIGVSTQVTASPDRAFLERRIGESQSTLDRLEAERRRYDRAAPRTTDPELSALRNQYQQLNGKDTLPPGTNPKRYAAELDELERMKAKFRRQQEERLQRRSGGSGRVDPPFRTQPSVPPSTPENTSRKAPTLRVATSSEAAYRHYQDSLRIANRIGSSLQQDNAPRAYEREAWENEVRRGLPRQEPLSAAEAARLDEDYQRQLAELEKLRSQLRRLEDPGAEQPRPSGDFRPTEKQDWQARSPYPTAPRQTQAPNQRAAYYSPPPANRASAGSPPSGRPTLTAAAMPAGIDFIPNTAYPDSRGYRGLEQLVDLLRQTNGALEIRVHTGLDQSPRVAQVLSEERAVTIRNHLLAQGIPEDRFRVLGFGNNLTGEEGERVEVIRQ